MEPLKINWGTLKEIPEMSINRFGGPHTAPDHIIDSVVRAYFLTDCEMETLEDLFQSSLLVDMHCPKNYRAGIGRGEGYAEKNELKRLYLHEMTYEFLLYWATTSFVKNGRLTISTLLKLKDAGKIIFMPIHVPIQIEFTRPGSFQGSFRSFCFQVTALSAGYDVGSIMLLFESMSREDSSTPWIMNDELRILYTGNCRVHKKDLILAKPLFQGPNGYGTIKPIHVLYLDTKYFLPHIEELPTRRQVTKKIVKEVSRKLHENSHIQVGFSTQERIGSLSFFQMFMNLTGKRFHVPEDLSRYFERALSGMKSTYQCALSARLHYDCEGWDKRSDDPNKLYTSVGDMCKWEAQAAAMITGRARRDIMMHVSLAFRVTFPDKYPFAQMTDDEICWGNGKRMWTELAPPTLRNPRMPIEVFHGLYVNNLSRFEAVRLIHFLQPKNIVPLYRSGDFSMDEIGKLIHSSCQEEEAIAEPHWVQRAYPSTSHDFTAKVDDDDQEDKEANSVLRGAGEQIQPRLVTCQNCQCSCHRKIPTGNLLDL